MRVTLLHFGQMSGKHDASIVGFHLSKAIPNFVENLHIRRPRSCTSQQKIEKQISSNQRNSQYAAEQGTKPSDLPQKEASKQYNE
jgi:hypothetical protein